MMPEFRLIPHSFVRMMTGFRHHPNRPARPRTISSGGSDRSGEPETDSSKTIFNLEKLFAYSSQKVVRLV